MPELLQSSARTAMSSDESIIYGLEEHQLQQQRLQEAIAFKYSSVNIFFGNEDVQNSGTTRITRNIFAGANDRTENAMLFLNNLNKIKQTKNELNLSKHVQMYRKLGKGNVDDGLMSQASYPTQLDADQVSQLGSCNDAGRFDSESGFESLDPVYEEQSQVDDDEVLLNVSPQKFEKPKDQLYMDFFVKYTEIFVDEAKKDPSSQKTTNKFSTAQVAGAPAPKNHQPAGGRMRLVATSSSR